MMDVFQLMVPQLQVVTLYLVLRRDYSAHAHAPYRVLTDVLISDFRC